MPSAGDPVTGPVVDLVVVGDGPAAAAVAAASADVGVTVVVVGPGAPWPATYATWLDDVPGLPAEVFAEARDRVVVHGRRTHVVDRPYGVFDNAALRAHLGLDDHLRRGTVRRIREDSGRAVVELADGGHVTASVAIDATGAAGRARAWQTGYGVVVDDADLPAGYPVDAATLMDWRSAVPVAPTLPTFVYAVPVAGGWLVEHTVLAASSAVDPRSLRAGLVARLGEAVVASAERQGRVEQVRIPIGAPPRTGGGGVLPFGAAAGMVHPASGYSVAAALRAAPRVARAIAAGVDADGLASSVWPRSARRARALHTYGLDVLLRLDRASTVAFFDAFFDLPVAVWAGYLRVDTDPAAVARAMLGVFRRVPWSVRRELVAGDVRALAGLAGRRRTRG